MRFKHTSKRIDTKTIFESILEASQDDKISLVLNHLELSRMVIHWFMQQESTETAGERYSHAKPNGGRYSRWGSNPGSVQIGGQKVRVDVPRVHDNETGVTSSPEIYAQLREVQEPPLHIMQALMRGIGTREYRQTAELLMDSFGLSKSTLSAQFVEHSKKVLEQFMDRRLDDQTYVAMFIDGKVLQQQSLIVVQGVGINGEKRILGITSATTENAEAITVMFRDMIERGLDVSAGILCVIDGGKGLRKAIDTVFGHCAVVQRCHVHKLKNVLSHFSGQDYIEVQKKLKAVFACEDFQEAESMAETLHKELRKMSGPAARSFKEGLPEILTLSRLKLLTQFGKTFRTTNCIESVNSGIARYTRHITNWTSVDHRLRWAAMALIELESRWKKSHKYLDLPILHKAIKSEVKRRALKNSSGVGAKRISTRKRT